MSWRALLIGAALAVVARAPAADAAEALRLTAGPGLAKDSAALPRIAAPLTPATARINAALGRLDRNWAGFVKECLAGGKQNEASRRVEIPMRGPRFLALLARDNEDCGGAHPDYSLTALTYDLTTGRPVDWARLLGPRLASAASTDSVIDGTTIGLVSSPELRKLYVRTLKATGGETAGWWKDCNDVLADEDLKFSVWPDARTRGLMLAPLLVHAVQACGDETSVPAKDLRPLGVDPALLAQLGG